MNFQKCIYRALIAMFLAFAPLSLISPATGEAYAQSVQIQPRSSEIFVDTPFELSVVLTDFDESSQPDIEPFEIENADIRFVGVSPRKSSFLSIVNGRRTQRVEITYVYNYQITPRKEGLYTIPVITAKQNGKEASSGQPINFSASSVPTTTDMKIEVTIPDKKVWVGQSFDVTIDWFLRKDVSGKDFKIPILNMPEAFDVQTPKDSYSTIAITSGTRQIDVPYSRNSVMVNGIEYTRFRMYVTLMAISGGQFEIPPASVVAELETDVTQDFWGFGRSNYKVFRAEESEGHTVTIADLPMARRPESFSNAMGTDFSIQVSADRTILKAGDPIVLTIDISSPSSIETVRLPSLTAAGLNDQLFGVSPDDPIGENIDGPQNRHIRRFTVPVRVNSDRVTEIPALAFSYFNPVTEQYATVHSSPISLNVASVDKIGVADVVSAQPAAKPAQAANGQPAQPAKAAAVDNSLKTLDLGLMSTKEALNNSTLRSLNKRPVRIALYILPFVLWGFVAVIRRARKSHQACAEQRTAAQNLKKALKDAQTLDAKSASSAIANALSAFVASTETPRDRFANVSQKIDDEAYKPNAGSSKLSPDLIKEFEQAVKEKTNEKYKHLINTIFALLLFIPMLLAAPAISEAQENSANAANDVRLVAESQINDPAAMHTAATDVYHKAMEATDRDERIAKFKQSAAIFDALSQKYSDSAELYVDAGNAYLGAVDFGRAALAYHRALTIDPAISQAKSNLAYIQDIQHDEASNVSFIQSAFFLSNKLTADMRFLIAAICFFVAVMLLIPWSRKNRRWISFMAVIPLIGWMWMMAGAFAQPKQTNGAIVMSESFLKTADNNGASNVSDNPVQPGIFVTVVESRDNWLQVKTNAGQKGWINRSAVEYIVPRS